MSRTQRIVLLGVAAIIALAAFVVLPGGDDDADPPSRAGQTTTTDAAPAADQEQAAPAKPKPKPKPKPPLLRAGAERELEFTKGETVRFRVRHDTAEEVHVHGYDITKDLRPGRTATVSFKADLEGIFEIELEQSGTPLGELKVEPK